MDISLSDAMEVLRNLQGFKETLMSVDGVIPQIAGLLNKAENAQKSIKNLEAQKDELEKEVARLSGLKNVHQSTEHSNNLKLEALQNDFDNKKRQMEADYKKFSDDIENRKLNKQAELIHKETELHSLDVKILEKSKVFDDLIQQGKRHFS